MIAPAPRAKGPAGAVSTLHARGNKRHTMVEKRLGKGLRRGSERGWLAKDRNGRSHSAGALTLAHVLTRNVSAVLDINVAQEEANEHGGVGAHLLRWKGHGGVR